MASFVYTPAKTKVLNAALNFATQDFRIILVMTNSTADTDQDLEFVGSIGTLDEYDGATYARITLAGETVTEDPGNNRAEFSANNISWATLGAGTRQALGMILYRFVTNDADSPLVAWIDTGGFPFSGNGGAVNVTWNAEGILQAT
jgi:hypothetical protein